MRLRILVLVLGLAFPAQASAHDLVLRPQGPTNRLVVYLHGAGGFARDIKEPLFAPLLEHGFAVASSEAHGRRTWGDPQSVADYEHLIDRLPYTRIYLVGGSMGGLATMQLIGRVHPEAVAIFSPVCNVDSLGNVLLQQDVRLKWGETPPTYLTPVVPHPEAGLPVLISASPEDTWVPKKTNANVCARELRRRGAHVREVRKEGDHGDPANIFTPSELLDFFRSRRPLPRAFVPSR